MLLLLLLLLRLWFPTCGTRRCTGITSPCSDAADAKKHSVTVFGFSDREDINFKSVMERGKAGDLVAGLPCLHCQL